MYFNYMQICVAYLKTFIHIFFFLAHSSHNLNTLYLIFVGIWIYVELSLLKNFMIGYHPTIIVFCSIIIYFDKDSNFPSSQINVN
jgi:hypothetical protein